MFVQWARDAGCPWSHETCEAAAAKGQLPALVWAVENGAPFNMAQCLLLAEGSSNEQRMVDWISVQE